MTSARRATTCAAIFLLGLASTGSAADKREIAKDKAPAPITSDPGILQFDCSQIQALGIDKQTNLRAALIRQHCGESTGTVGQVSPPTYRRAAPASINALGGVDVNIITGTETFPAVTQSESFVWGEGNTYVSTFNDSRTAPNNYSGGSVSTDAGATWTRFTPSPFETGHGTNYGDPTIVFNKRLNLWFASFLATGCGGQGIGLWTSPDGQTWTAGACAHNGGADDRQSFWVDNNASSPYYGRMYCSWNDFGSAQEIKCTYSDDGVAWTPVNVTATFIRNCQLTGSLGTDGTVFVAGMDEGGGGNANRTNIMYRSTDGGATWTSSTMGASFPPAGQNLCGYFNAITPIWRHMGWGQPVVGPGGVVHYPYCGRGLNANDEGDVFYTRSTDNGATWSTPIVLNSDQATGGTHEQWMPSASISPQGNLLLAWYDRRNTTNGTDYEYWGILSQDNGQTFQADTQISDVVAPSPAQPDPNVQPCYVGDYNYHSSAGNTALVTWCDGRNQVNGTNQQDVYFDKILFCPTITITPASLPNGIVGTPYSQTLTASGGAAPYAWAITVGALPPGLALNAGTGVISGTPTTTGTYCFTATATDANQCTASQSYCLIVNPSGCTPITISPTTLPNGLQGVAYSQTLTATGGTPPFTWAVTAGSLPPGLALGAASGVISGVPGSPGTYNFTVTATDTPGCTGSQPLSITIDCGTVSLLPAGLPNGAIGLGYSQTITAVGGTSPYTFAVTAGALPPGLTLAASGVISGVPNTVGTFSFTVTATDPFGCSGSQPYTITVTLCPTPNIYCEQFTGGLNSTTATDVCNADAVWYAETTCPSSALPGHSAPDHVRWGIQANCGLYASAPAGTVDYLETPVLDVSGCGGSASLSFNYLLNYQEGSSFDRARVEAIIDGGAPVVIADNGPGGPVSGCTGGSNPGTGGLSGSGWQPKSFTITAASTLQVRFVGETDDSIANSGEGFFIDDVIVLCPFTCPVITVAPPTLPGGSVGAPYSQTITASGGNAPYTFTVTAGALPTGLALTPAGILSGTPTAAGTFNFTVMAMDVNGCSGTQAYTVVMSACNPITVNPSTLPNGTVGAAYSQTLTASGGTAPYTFAVSAGTLPAGLALAAGGVLSGTPSAAGSFTFSVTAQDSAGCTGSRSYTIVIGVTVDYIVGEGLGQTNPNRVRVYLPSGAPGTTDFLAYVANQWGTNVASGDVDTGTYDEILTGPGPGPVYGPQVKSFRRDGTFMPKINFYAYGTLRYGVNVGSANVDGDVYDEILSGAGPGAAFGPHVRGWNFDNNVLTPIAKISYFAYGTLKFGVNVTGGSVDADAFEEIATGPGPGQIFAPQVRGWNYDGTTITSINKINFNAFTVLQYGANVAVGNVDADAFAEIAASPGPGAGANFPSRFRGFNYDATAINPLTGFDITPFTTTFFGGRAGIADVNNDGTADLLCGAGRDVLADSTVKAYQYNGTTLTQLPGSFLPFATDTYGVNVAGGKLGY
ncbi:MAG: putative Ig domain-containing protein [Acidobacteriota bacterium]